jgi:pyruvate,water dikinase
MISVNKKNDHIRYVLDFEEIDKTMVSVAGGKGASLGELSQISGIHVPPGFCVTTNLYHEIIGKNPMVNSLLEQLVQLKTDQAKEITELAKKIRKVIEEISIPKYFTEEIISHLEQTGKSYAYAVRSSATAEDLQTASFAGQQDTYLNISGGDAIIKHISKCWASLYTDRAVMYRLQTTGFEHKKLGMAVVIQQMIFPFAAGVMFTADPLTSNRKILSVDVCFGLGEAIVSGLVNADNYKVLDNKIADKKISTKKLAINALIDGGTKKQAIPPELQNRQVLTDEQILQLEQIGRKIEDHFGHPQDIEWCMADNAFYIVQSRPITTLYPVPERNDTENHIYISVGHQQMMTDAIRPLGLSLWQLTAGRPMYTAGGRLFVDVAPMLASPEARKNLLELMDQHDPLIKDALLTLIDRENFIKPVADDKGNLSPIKSSRGKSAVDILAQAGDNPAIVFDLIKKNEASLAAFKQSIQSKSGAELLDAIMEDIPELKKILFDPQSSRVIMAAVDASAWLNEKMQNWLGEKNVADILSQSVSNNVTSDMGRELLDVADLMRPYAGVIDYLQDAKAGNFFDELLNIEGGQQARNAISTYLDKYGMRCTGEIDITKARWSEEPITLVPIILSHIKNLEPGAGRRKFESGLQEAFEKEQELLSRLIKLPDGEQKAAEAKQMINVLRDFIGYREYPKYGMINRYFIYKQALLKVADQLLQSGIMREQEDIYYLTFEELRETVNMSKADHQLIRNRKEEYKLYEKLNPPRVITSDGEIIRGKYKSGKAPAEAIMGLGVSSGIIEGRARVILDMKDADLKGGDILITPFTDPSWTPLFLSIKGLVTEVGGLMTHGAVIAREYGLPAVVGVENATKLIKDGQHIRINGTEGYIQILPSV